jgi:Putative rhamnosyl transferase
MAAKSIFVITRYSVLGGPGGWRKRKTATSLEEYKAYLFSDERMNARIALFSSITAESIARQLPCDANLFFVVLTSEDLPAEHRAKLDEVMRDVEKRSDFTCAVIGVPSEGLHEPLTDAFIDDQFAGGPDQRFATVRLDDDDALAVSFCQRLTTHLDQGLCGYPVSFAYGYEGVVHADGRFTDVRHWNHPKASAGLAFTNAWTSTDGYADPRRHVYMLGRHITIDLADAVLIDSRTPAYFKTESEHRDSRVRAYRADLPAVKQHEWAADEFPWLSSHVDLPSSGDGSTEEFNPALATSARARHRHEVRELKGEIAALKKKLKKSRAAQGRRPRIRTAIRRRLGRLRRRG